MAAQSSHVRDHLANERTFLAWVRTGIALLGFGFIVARLRFELGSAVPERLVGRVTIGILFVITGMATLVFATTHYLSTRRMIDSGTFEPLGRGALILTGVSLAIGVAVLLNLLGLARLPW